MNFQMPNIPKFENPLEAKHNCEHIDFCKSLNITTDDCYAGANYARRCNQGQYANIVLLSKIIQSFHHDKE